MLRIGPSEAIPDGEYRIVDAGARSVLVARVKGKLHALENVCSHQSLRLDGGALKTGPVGEPCIECPHHAMWFDLRDGRVVVDAGHVNPESVRAIGVREENGSILLDL